MAAEYGYVTGDFLPSPGYLKIAVDKAITTIPYIRTPSVNAGNGEHSAPEVVFEYRLSAMGHEKQPGEAKTGAEARLPVPDSRHVAEGDRSAQ
jgi:hypothetical protein